MTHTDRINALLSLGKVIENLSEEALESLARRAYAHNNWFTPENVRHAFAGIAQFLQQEKIEQWLAAYPALAEERPPRKIGLVMAGNIPMVGFHDLLCCLLAGHQAHLKLSSQDKVLMQFLLSELREIAPEMSQYIVEAEMLKGMDAMIATGSDNTSRYFEYYFSKLPHIIRKNRSSCAVLDGTETKEELEALGEDMFRYFGLGCRNVSKLFVPEGYNFHPLFEALEPWKRLHDQHKYTNNYDYNKSIYLINKVDHLDTGFALYTENEALVSPISVVYYQTYSSKEQLAEVLAAQREKIQCIAGREAPAGIPFGQAQQPDPWDYADGVDTLDFLLKLR